MAGRQAAKPAPEGAADPQVEGVGPDGDAIPGAQVNTDAPTIETTAPPLEFAPPVTEEERALAIARLLNPDGSMPALPEPAPAPDYDPDVDEASDFGGRVVVVVTSNYYVRRDEGTLQEARKGDLVKVTAAEADRGEEHGFLRRATVAEADEEQ